MTHIKTTLGAILLGCMFSTSLSGMTVIQTFLYCRLYPKDPLHIKLLVLFIWLLDSTHAVLICAATWDYFILNFGNDAISDVVPVSIALTVAFTAIITFTTHLFFSHRVYRLSRKNLYITVPIVVLALIRLCAASVSTVEMAKLKSFQAFVHDYGYVFTLGLSAACTVDVLITVALCYFLQISRTGFGEMDHIIDSIMLYTVNNGLLTCITTVVSLIFWVTMPGNLIFLGLHFSISKLYANSLLSTLNSRRSLRHHRTKCARGRNGDHALPVLFPSSFGQNQRSELETAMPSRGQVEQVSKLEISVEKTVQFDMDEAGLGANSEA